jgi:hypothetical protein
VVVLVGEARGGFTLVQAAMRSPATAAGSAAVGVNKVASVSSAARHVVVLWQRLQR